ncbi:MAG: hypothetical protein IH936_14625 [Acidobacteria bacterium]|nr:hypothetical protein [Acidobacteriota bacterium]
MSSVVDVTLDSTGLAAGTYEAKLCVNSNDTVTPQIQVPVTLTVGTVGPCGFPDTLVLTSQTLSGTQVHQACTSIEAEDILIQTGADITFRAGSSVKFLTPLEVETGADVTVEIDPALLP